MAYSRSTATITKRRDLLRPLLRAAQRGSEASWHSSPSEAPKRAYEIRECLWIAATLYPRQFPELARIYETYSIRVSGATTIAAPREGNGEPTFGASLQHQSFEFERHSAPAAEHIVSSAISSAEIIQAWLDKQPSAQPFHILNATISDEELTELQRWASNLEPAWEVLHQDGSNEIILQPAGIS